MNNRFKNLFFWLSGAGTDTLEACPGWEQRKYVAFGATVLVPCLFAFIASAYAISTLTNDPRVIYPIAGVWSFIILSIDRALLASYRPFQSWIRTFGQFALRFVVAMLMGITIAHPLVLLLFRDTITTVIENERAADIQKAASSFDTVRANIESDIAKVQKDIADQRALWSKTFQADFIVAKTQTDDDQIPGLTDAQKEELKQAIATAVAPFNSQLKDVDTQLTALTPAYAKVQTELGFWQSEFERELNGQRSGLVGDGPRAKSIRADQLEPRQQESARLSGLISQLSTSKSALQAQAQNAEKQAIATYQQHLTQVRTAAQAEDARVAALQHQVQQSQADTFVTQQNALRATIKAQIDADVTALNSDQQQLSRANDQEAAQVETIRSQPRRDILTQTLALHTLFQEGQDAGRFALWTYVVLTGLFMLVDTIPLVVKFFTKPGPYDTLLDRDEVSYDAGHKAFLGTYMQQLASGNLMAVTRNRRLETALLDGVEHSRAAREFLDSLIEMERAFSEKIQMERETGLAKTPESLAALEAIKKRFYEDLHHRMEQFFTQGSAPA